VRGSKIREGWPSQGRLVKDVKRGLSAGVTFGGNK
jgi:hypothetical protein